MKIEDIKLALKEICDSNPDICVRVDVFDSLEKDNANKTHEIPVVKGVTFRLFLNKDKDIFDYPYINRFYAYGKDFNEEYKYDNKFFGALFDSISAVKEKCTPFRYLKLNAISRDPIELFCICYSKQNRRRWIEV